MDYDELIDDEIWDFIRKTESHYPPDAVDLSIDEQRGVYDRMCRAFFAGYPDGLSVRDGRAGSVPIRIYEKGNPSGTVIYFHGGGYVVGGLESHDDVCAELSQETGLRVISVDYRLSPEHKHPAAYKDGLEAVRYVALTWPKPIILAGDSAGANLASTCAHALRGEIEFAGQVLIYPALGGDMSKGSYLDHANAPMLTLDDIKFYETARFSGPAPTNDPTALPLQDRDFSALPPTVTITAQNDPLADDGRDYRDAIVAAGGQAIWVNEPGLVHGYLRARHSSARAKASFERITRAVSLLFEGGDLSDLPTDQDLA